MACSCAASRLSQLPRPALHNQGRPQSTRWLAARSAATAGGACRPCIIPCPFISPASSLKPHASAHSPALDIEHDAGCCYDKGE